METLPSRFVKNIGAAFGDEGKLWLASLGDTLDKCRLLWNLTECRPVENLSFNYVCAARSERFGPVILKIGVKGDEIRGEKRALNLIGQEKSCRCLDFSGEMNALLLERLLPGESLKSLADREEQIRIAAGLLEKAAPLEKPGQEGFPLYGDWLDRTFSRARGIEKFSSRAMSFYGEIERSPLPAMLLHGDFHHENILRKGERWMLIDPKGVLGKQTSESGRFILNHLWDLPRGRHRETLEKLARVFAAALGTSEEMVLKGAYTEHVLSCSWTLEGDPDGEEKDDICRELQYYDNLYGGLLG